MTPLPPAVSLTHSFTEIGALVALAGLLGIGLLSLLLFSQGREIKRLREWAGRAPERAAELEQRLAAATPAPPRPVTPGPGGQSSGVRPIPRTAPVVAHTVDPAVGPGVVAAAVAESAGLVTASAPVASEQAIPTATAPAVGTAGTEAPSTSESPPDQPPLAAADGAVVATSDLPAADGGEQLPNSADPLAVPVAGEPGVAVPPATAAAMATGATVDAAAPSSGGGAVPVTAVPVPAIPVAATAVGEVPVTTSPAGEVPVGEGPVAAVPVGAATGTADPGSLIEGSAPLVSSQDPPAIQQPVGETSAAAAPTPPAREETPLSTDALAAAVARPTHPAPPRPATPPQDWAPGRASGERQKDHGADLPHPSEFRFVKEEPARRRPRPAFFAIAVLALVAIAAAVVLTGGGSSSHPSATATSAGGAGAVAHTHTAATPSAATLAAQLRIDVFNSTEVPGLAHKLAGTLRERGFVAAQALATRPPGTYSTSAVEYAPGYDTEAERVARALGIETAAVSPLQAGTQALAGGASVVVIAAQAEGSAGAEAPANTGGEAGAGEGNAEGNAGANG